MHSITLSPDTFARLQALAIPLIDTPETVIGRALDALEQGDALADSVYSDNIRSFYPEAPPNLAFTTVRSICIDGESLPRFETYWNSGLTAAIKIAVKRGVSKRKIAEIIQINSFDGRKEVGGYKYVAEADLSVQGQDANAAWRALCNLAKMLLIDLEVIFSWQENSKAAHPGGSGRFRLPGRTQ